MRRYNIYHRKDGRFEGRLSKGKKRNGHRRFQYFFGKTRGEVEEKIDAYRLETVPKSDCTVTLKELFRDDVYLDLAAIHIDNEAPTATIPESFKDWHNYFFKDEVTISLTDISETLDKNATKVYECPRKGERTEIPFTYDAETDTLSFTLKKGQHHIDITLVDEAGNEWNIDRVRYLQVGNFWLCIGGAGLVVIAVGIGFFVWRKKKR